MKKILLGLCLASISLSALASPASCLFGYVDAHGGDTAHHSSDVSGWGKQGLFGWVITFPGVIAYDERVQDINNNFEAVLEKDDGCHCTLNAWHDSDNDGKTYQVTGLCSSL